MVKDHLGSGSLLDQLKFRNRIIALIPAARSPRLYDSLPRGRAAVKRESTSSYKVLDMRKRPCILVLSASLRRRETSPMETALPTQSQTSGKSPSGPFRGFLADAIRFWEPRRLVYNFVLAAVVMVWLVASWPHFRPAFTLHSLLLLSILALLANVCYCAAYFVDIPMQGLSVGDALRRLRWGLWLTGTAAFRQTPRSSAPKVVNRDCSRSTTRSLVSAFHFLFSTFQFLFLVSIFIFPPACP